MLVDDARIELATAWMSTKYSTAEIIILKLAPGVGIEPTIAESKSVVLPLHYPGIKIGALDKN